MDTAVPPAIAPKSSAPKSARPNRARPNRARRIERRHPLARLVAARVGIGLITLLIVSIIIFWATEVLPGNAAYAISGHSATPARLHALEVQMGLEKGVVSQYWSWVTGVLTGNLGKSLADGQPVWAIVGPRP